MSNKGQSLVELAISFVIIMFLLSGAVEFGIVFFQYIQLQDAAQEGALYGSICQNPTAIENRVKGASNSPIRLETDAAVEIKIDEPEGDDVAIRVAVEYPHKIFMPFVPRIIGSDSIRLRGVVVDTILVRTKECQ